MHITLAAAADAPGESWWLAPLVGLVVGALGFSGGLLVRRHEAREARDEMTRRAAADVWTSAAAVMRAAVIALEEGHPEVWKYRPRRRRQLAAYDRYNDALQHSHKCHGVLAIWRPELTEPSKRLLRAHIEYRAGDEEQAQERVAAGEAFLAAVRKTLP